MTADQSTSPAAPAPTASTCDAAINLGAALMASQTLQPGVYVCMSGRVIPAGAALRDRVTGRFVEVARTGQQ